MQLTHHQVKNTTKKFSLVVCLDGIRTPENVGMAFRVCEAFGVEKLFLHRDSPDVNSRSVKRISRDTNQSVSYEYVTNFHAVINDYRKNGYKILAIELTDKSLPIQDITIKSEDKLVLIFGSERNGISKDLLEEAEGIFHIVMYGKNSSMNVVNSMSVALYEITNQLARHKK